jgi:hypothetical protein
VNLELTKTLNHIKIRAIDLNFYKGSFMNPLFKTISLMTAFAVLAPSLALAQNVAPRKGHFNKFKIRASDSFDGGMLPGIGSAGEAAVGGFLSYATVESLVTKDIATLSRLRAMKSIGTTGVLALDLNADEFSYLWKQYLIDEKQAVEVARAEQLSAKEAMEAAKQSLANISKLPNEVNVGTHSASLNSQKMYKSNTDLLAKMRKEYSDASKSLAEAEGNLARRRLQFFNPAEKEIFNSAGARAVRAEVDRYAGNLRRGVYANVAGSLLGAYLLIDGIYKFAIVVDGRESGFAPIFYGTQN